MIFNRGICNSISKKRIHVIQNSGKDNIVILKLLDEKVSTVTMNDEK